MIHLSTLGTLSHCGRGNNRVMTSNLDEVTCRLCNPNLPPPDMKIRRREEYAALAKLRDAHREEFDASREEIRRGGDYYPKLHELRRKYLAEYELLFAEEEGKHKYPTRTTKPMVPAGKATCYRCGGILIEHRIGQCRPEAYSLWR